MRQILFRIPYLDLPIYGYGVMVLLGALFGLLLLRREAARHGWNLDVVTDISVFSVIGGLIGGRIFYCIQFYDEQFAGRPFVELLKIWNGGLVLYGGIIGGTVVMVSLLRLRKIRVLPFLDAVAPSLAIGIAFGRLGCFLNGCCWGQQCSPDAWYAARFPEGSAIYSRMVDVAARHPELGIDPANYPVIPTQLFSSGLALLLAAVLFALQRPKPPSGLVTGSFLVLYALIRYGIELFRGDHDVQAGDLTVSQGVSVVGLSIGVALIALALRSRRSAANDKS